MQLRMTRERVEAIAFEWLKTQKNHSSIELGNVILRAIAEDRDMPNVQEFWSLTPADGDTGQIVKCVARIDGLDERKTHEIEIKGNKAHEYAEHARRDIRLVIEEWATRKWRESR